MDMKIFYDEETIKKRWLYIGRYVGLILIFMGVPMVLCIIVSEFFPIIFDTQLVRLLGILLYLAGFILSVRLVFKAHEIASCNMFSACDGNIYCTPKIHVFYRKSVRKHLFIPFITAYRIADGQLLPPESMKKKEKQLSQLLDENIDKGNGVFPVEQMSNIVLTPIPSGGYEVEYTAQFGDKYSRSPTKVKINPGYTDYEELVWFLQNYGKGA